MALVVRITARGSSRPEIVRVGNAATRIKAAPGARYQFVDEATGQAPSDAVAHKAGHDLLIRTANGDSIRIEGFYDLGGAQAAAFDMPGVSVAAITPLTDLLMDLQAASTAAGAGGTGAASGSAAGAAAGAGAGLGSALPIALGAVALGAGAAAAGGGGGSSGPPPDTTPPVAPSGLKLDAADDSGASNSDNITSQAGALTVSGSAEANAKIEIYSGLTLLVTVTAAADGSFTADLILPTGANNITARAIDAAGNIGLASSALVITVDQAAPAAPSTPDLAAVDDLGVSNSDDLTSQTSGLTFTGTAEAGAKVELFDGTILLGSATASSGGAYSIDAALAGGSHSITTRATDVAGNVGVMSAALAVAVDATAPEVPAIVQIRDSGVSASDGITNQATGLTIYGEADPGAIIKVMTEFRGFTRDVLGQTIVDASGRYTLDVTYTTSGAVDTVRVEASDLAGNSSRLPVRLTVDTFAPAKPATPDFAAEDDTGVRDYLTTQTSGLTFTTSVITNIGVSNDVVGYRVFDSGTAITTATSGQFDLSLAPGIHRIAAAAIDRAGNIGALSDERAVFVARVATTGLRLDPASDTGLSNSDGVTRFDTGLTFTGHAEAGSAVTLTLHDLFRSGLSDVIFGTATADGSGNFTLTGDFPPAGPGGFLRYRVTASGVDSLGIAIIPQSIVVQVDTKPDATVQPDLTAADDSGVNNDNITDNSSGLTFTGPGSVADQAVITVDGHDVGTVPFVGAGLYSIDLALASGTHQVAARVLDLAGNIGPIGPALSMTVNPGHDDLTGTAGADILVGSAAANNIYGGLGRDVMVGGAGADTFFLEPPSGQTLTLADVIADFQVGTDHLSIDPNLAPTTIRFADLTIAQGSGSHAADTIISVTAGGAVLAVLEQVTASTVTAASFTF